MDMDGLIRAGNGDYFDRFDEPRLERDLGVRIELPTERAKRDFAAEAVASNRQRDADYAAGNESAHGSVDRCSTSCNVSIRCECGSASIGGGGHSDWCPAK